MNDTVIWLGIVFCITQSAIMSGLNLAIFNLSRLRLEVAAKAGDANAKCILALRRDANFTLATILWGNVGINVLLTLLAESVLAGITTFLFSTMKPLILWLCAIVRLLPATQIDLWRKFGQIDSPGGKARG